MGNFWSHVMTMMKGIFPLNSLLFPIDRDHEAQYIPHYNILSLHIYIYPPPIVFFPLLFSFTNELIRFFFPMHESPLNDRSRLLIIFTWRRPAHNYFWPLSLEQNKISSTRPHAKTDWKEMIASFSPAAGRTITDFWWQINSLNTEGGENASSCRQ